MTLINALVPELECLDLAGSLAFYTGVLGFSVLYERPEKGFSFLGLGAAQIMLKQANGYWETGPLDHPLGRGINFQITVPRIAEVLARLKTSNVKLFSPPETSWYRTGKTERGQIEFLVQDPDGYLLRFAEFLGERPAS